MEILLEKQNEFIDVLLANYMYLNWTEDNDTGLKTHYRTEFNDYMIDLAYTITDRCMLQIVDTRNPDVYYNLFWEDGSSDEYSLIQVRDLYNKVEHFIKTKTVIDFWDAATHSLCMYALNKNPELHG